MYAGESVRFIRSEEPATEIARQIAEGAERILRTGLGADEFQANSEDREDQSQG